MLSETWEQYRGDNIHRRRLFQGIARVMLSLARVPQPRIGSFQFNDDGTITLTNRPLQCTTMILENDGTPRTMQRSETYSCTEPFVADWLHFHDQRFISDPNATFGYRNCRHEMCDRVLFRAIAHNYIRRDTRNGPFFLQLDDLHPSNIFVDKQWNITSLVDLEWICALPVENLYVPYWVTGQAIDGIENEKLAEFEKVRDEFMDILEEEEQAATAEHSLSLTQVMRESSKSGAEWFWHGIGSVNAMACLSRVHPFPRFSGPISVGEQDAVFKFWCQSATEIVQRKVREYNAYKQELENLFR